MKASSPVEKKAVLEPFAVMENPDKSGNIHGELVVYETAVASIVKRVVTAVHGVARLSGNSFVDNIAEIVRSRKIQDRSISLRFSEHTVEIDLMVFIYFGVSIPEVAAEIQREVSSAIAKITGLTVSRVNINVRGIEDEPADEEEKQETAN